MTEAKEIRFKTWNVTGTCHGSIIEAPTEGEARRIFHRYYKGESILNVLDRTDKNYWKRLINPQPNE